MATEVIAIANQKGGVGKTTTAINLATAMAAIDKRILIIDLDPQGNASTGLGVERDMREITSYDVLLGAAPLVDAILPSEVPGLELVASTVDLSGADLELADLPQRNFRLRQAIEAALAGSDHQYDYILIDCPPSLNLLTINALSASDSVLVPLQCEFFALEGLSLLLDTINQVKSALNPALVVKGVVLTMYDGRNNLSVQVEADVRGFMGDQVFTTTIPRNIRMSEAPSFGKPALLYDHRCAGSRAYIDLAREILTKDDATNDAA